MNQIEISIPVPLVTEAGSFTATAYFRTRATKAASAPTTADYKIMCISTGVTVRDWTALTPAASIAIPITYEDNAIQRGSNMAERKSITVRADAGLDTQQIHNRTWIVKNIGSI